MGCRYTTPINYLIADIPKFYIAIYLVSPVPRRPLPSEKKFRTIGPDEKVTEEEELPCWQDSYVARKKAAEEKGEAAEKSIEVEDAEVFMSLVVPAYNEEERLGIMLTEAVQYLQENYSATAPKKETQATPNGSAKKRNPTTLNPQPNGHASPSPTTSPTTGWEILIISDGSTDNTISTALDFAKTLSKTSPSPSSSNIRVISLRENRGKGGAVTHGMRHVRGQYAIFADADGASKFEDLGKLVRECGRIEDERGRGVAVGSRAHLVGSEAVVKV